MYFDDVKITHTKTPVLQYNEYYPFGLQTANSWTREGTTNDFLYNAGTELNATSGYYETPFRSYDAALGRFMQVDALAPSYGSQTPYNYANNDPVYFSDPTGLYGQGDCSWCSPVPSRSGNGEIMDPISRQPQIGSLFDGYTGGSFTGGWGEGYGSAGIARGVSAAAERYFDRAGGAANITRRLREIHKKILESRTNKPGSFIIGPIIFGAFFDNGEQQGKRDTFKGGRLYKIADIYKALNDMWKASQVYKGEGYRENAAIFTDEGILVLPNEFNGLVNGPDNIGASDRFLSTIINSDQTQVTYNDQTLNVIGFVHTHPDPAGSQGHSMTASLSQQEHRYFDRKIGNFVLSNSGVFESRGPYNEPKNRGRRTESVFNRFIIDKYGRP